MTRTIDAQLVEEALAEIALVDTGGQMAKVIEDARHEACISRHCEYDVKPASLALLITGSDKACETLAKAYTKALYGLGLIDGKAGNPASKTIDWTGQICDNEASRTMQEQSWASRKMTEAGKAARSGTLVIRDIHRKPYEGSPDEAEASGPALKGALEAVTEFVTKGTWGPRTPVVVLTGPEVETRAFIAATPELAKLFNNKSVYADACPPLPEVYSTELESPITTRRPLTFKPRNIS
ncbi:MAG: hypothetical protein ACAH80_01415 [Alphaproteobacteria bacterium]